MIRVSNIYYMLSYAYKELQKGSYESIGEEDFDNADDLFAVILYKGLTSLIKRGIKKEYIPHTEQTPSPKGRFLLDETVKKNALIHKEIVCLYDEYSENTLFNRIIKATLLSLLKNSSVKKENRRNLRKIMVYFETVDVIDLANVDWSNIRFNRNNEAYRLLLNICYLSYKNLIQNKNGVDSKMNVFKDTQEMSHLYEKFILEYYRKHYPSLKANPDRINWALSDNDEATIDFLPMMKTDITLHSQKNTLVIDAKYYDSSGSMSISQFGDKKTFHSNNLYQIFSYVKNLDPNNTGNVKGMLLYALDENDTDFSYTFNANNNAITVASLDLSKDFTTIKNKLNSIANGFESVGRK